MTTPTRAGVSPAGRRRRSRRHRAVLATLAGVLLVAGWLVSTVVAAQASAHTYLLSTTPANGATVRTAPAEVAVTLSEPVALSTRTRPDVIAVATGSSVADGRVRVEGATLTVGVRPDLPDGVYLVTWRVISADTHAVGGSVQFGVNVPATATPAGADPGGGPASSAVTGTTLAESAAKAVVYAGLVAAVGMPAAAVVLVGGVGVVALARRRWWRLLLLGGLAATGCGAVAQWATLAATGVDVAGSRIGLLIAVRVAATAAVTVVALTVPRSVRARDRRLRRAALGGVGAVGAVVAVTAVAGVGHGGAGSGWQWAATAAHGAAATFWLAGLVLLPVLMLRSRLDTAQVRRLGRWSACAASAVAALLITGVVRGLDTVGPLAALWATGYGRVLLAKVVVAGAALVVAGYAVRWRRHAAGTADGRPAPGATAALRLRVWSETAAVAVALLLAMVLSDMAPAAATYRPVAAVATDAGPYRIEVRVDPARPGSQQVGLRVVPGAATDPAPSEVRGVLADRAGAITGIEVGFPVRATEPAGPGVAPVVVLHSAAVTVPRTGTWRLQVTVVVDRWRQYVGAVDYAVR